ncbi:hypothetical protein DRQ09_05975 [candidate division KSB1 bacterium]|nr:MAG: hypothetical protein DRQ09_05975 [candidate division KSB1 bacterium]
MSGNRKVSRRKFLNKSLKYWGCIYSGSVFNYIKVENRDEFDLIIKNCSIVDGTGADEYKADIGIKSDKIITIGNLSSRTSKKYIDVKGYIVSPGFIDIHSHTDIDLFVNPRAESKIHQGVTTEIGGQCGSSAGPWRGESLEKIKKYLFERYELNVDWMDIGGFFDRLERNKSAVNLASMVGHGTIRESVMGMNNRKPLKSEIDEMKKLLMKSIEEGAYGLSTGLEYTPGSFATTEEIIELAKLLSKYNLTYASHIRNEDDRVLEAVKEAIDIGKKAGVSVQISHLKTIGERNYSKIDEVFYQMEKARNEKLNINFDRYPYIAYSTGMDILFPLWAREGGNEKFIERLKDNQLKSKMKKKVIDKIELLGNWNKIMICNTFNKKYNYLNGKRIGDLAKENNEEPYELIVKLLIENGNRVGIVGFGMSEENTQRILVHPLGMIASDGSNAAPYGKLSKGKPHPRYYGTFPRAIGYYCREKKIFDLPAVIKKITSMPAEKVGIKDRGKIKEGYFADLTIFDYNKIIDRATFINPHRYPEGIKYVIVNGKIVIKNGEHTGNLPGRVLRFKK